MKKIFIGWDSREDVAYQVCKFSINRHKTIDLEIIALKQIELRELGVYYREVDKLASTEFSLTRFLVPYLSNYQGFSIFCDCDFLFKDDIQKLFNLIDTTKAVSVVKHDYNPINTTKMDGKTQHLYPRKNWSSLIVFNNQHPSNQKLTKEIVNTETPAYLHRFSWLQDHEIGEIPYEWNYLIGWYQDLDNPKALHYTEGGPWLSEYKDCQFSQDWINEYNLMKNDI